MTMTKLPPATNAAEHPDPAADHPAAEHPDPAADHPAADHSEHRALLVALYLELSAEIDQATEIVGTWSSAVGEGGDDEVDTGSRSAQREQDAAVLATIRERRQQVERSIERIDAGVYGTCEFCGEPIPAARLEVFPSATTCVACKRYDERRA